MTTPPSSGLLRDLTDEEARRALPAKWGMADADVLPAWVAEMDFAVAEPVLDAVREAGAVTLCTQCAVRRDLTQADLLPGIRLAGAAGRRRR